jgi:hypothetical protein
LEGELQNFLKEQVTLKYDESELFQASYRNFAYKKSEIPYTVKLLFKIEN